MTHPTQRGRLTGAGRRGAAVVVITAIYALIIGTTLDDVRADDSLATREEGALRAAAERVAESVVQIRTIGGIDTLGRTLLPDGPTTGLVISTDGYIVSSAFNFVQQPASILVTFGSGKQVPAELVATDHSRMIVLLKAAGVTGLSVPELAPAGETRVGQWAVAVGRTFRADRTNVSVGIVSAVNRMFGRVLQTDADVSMANYGGPVVDVRGRVLGVIVPMAPQGASEVAGIEWYDSGIGFAVPLDAIREPLEQMKRGEDLHAGILGIGLSPRNPHTAPAVLAAVRPDSPAGKAGLKKGDRLIELEGKPIRTQTDLRFALGTRYGGDSLEIVAQRGEQRIERKITLAGKLPAFRHAFLGILPMRLANEPTNDAGDGANGTDTDAEPTPAKPAADDKPEESRGIVVRMVYPGSPAETAGVQAGDRIHELNGAAMESIESAISEMNNVAPESVVTLQLERGGESTERTLSATELPTNVPSELPPAHDDGVGSGAQSSSINNADSGDDPTGAAGVEGSRSQPTAGETRELTLPEFPQQCKIYVPAGHEAGRPLGVLLWLHGGDKASADEVIGQWKGICDRDGLLLVVPSAAEENRWERTELEYLGRLIARVVTQHKIDPRRVAVYGHEAGGAMAWSMGLSVRNVVRGVATSAAPLPRRISVPPNDPSLRLAILAAIPADKDAAVSVQQGLQKCSEAGYPVSAFTLANENGQLAEGEREQIARWIDTLDRF